jgi:hypothetical protein
MYYNVAAIFDLAAILQNEKTSKLRILVREQDVIFWIPCEFSAESNPPV